MTESDVSKPKKVVPPREGDATVPQLLSHDFLTKFPKLSTEQAGHLRHFHNLVAQKDGDWHHMGSQEPGQEWLDAYRYQLATMAYATGAAHYHRLPLLRSVFKTLLESLIRKMMLRDVWGYWFLTSHSGKLMDPDLTELRQPWADPVVRENIMYSGHLLLMISLYTMLFNDDKFNEEGALEFNWCPVFWGMGPERFTYNRASLQAAIVREMEREGWLGVCCEPNSIFIVCNQFPLIAIRYNDVRDGTSSSATVLEQYQAAWKAKGMFQENGLYIDSFSPKQDRKRHAKDVGFTAWAVAFLNSWNPASANSAYNTVIRSIPLGSASLDGAYKSFAIKPLMPGATVHLNKPVLGYTSMMISEAGDLSTLQKLLDLVDNKFTPNWDEGGLFYAPSRSSNNSCVDMDRFTGNAAIAYARLNVPQGQRKMYENPWGNEHFANYPFIDNVDLSSGVDFLRGNWDQNKKTLVLTLRSFDGQSKWVEPQLSGFAKGSYCVYQNGKLIGVYDLFEKTDIIQLDLQVTAQELDVVIKLV
ncbi:unnamed protein product [Clonostachys byssicola]|uniref:Linalool dehydratase/isomerase domain-containing protein n=1 Tax=Clonostachys byssicola TaxID=160290 RepID=A0A9N9XY89_9HYPO|nr:unnamed protein product [Clonostachys byssicola]